MITLNVTDLKKLIDQLIEDEIEYVDFDICTDNEYNVQYLSTDAYDGYGGGIIYDPINEVKISVDYRFDIEDADDR